MRCQDVRRALPLLVAGEMPLTEWALLEAHLVECVACRGELDRPAGPGRAARAHPATQLHRGGPGRDRGGPGGGRRRLLHLRDQPSRSVSPRHRPHATAPAGRADRRHAGGPVARAGDRACASGRAPDSARSARTRSGDPDDPEGRDSRAAAGANSGRSVGDRAPSGAGSGRGARARRAAGGGAHADAGAPARRCGDRGAGRGGDADAGGIAPRPVRRPRLVGPLRRARADSSRGGS